MAESKPNKRDQLIKLLKRKNGASIDDIVKVTGWQPHSSRAALTGLRKSGHAVSSERIDGVRRYRIEPAAAK